MSGIRKKFFFQLLYSFSQLAFPLVTYPYITRKLGAEGLGTVGYIEYVTGFIITIASFGIPFYGVREIARWQNEPAKKEGLLKQLFSFHLLVSLIGCILFLFLIKTNHKQTIPVPLLVLGCANIILPSFIAEWYMQGTEAFIFTTVRGIILRFLGLIAMFVFISTQQDYIIYYLIIVMVQVAVAGTNMYRIGLRKFLPQIRLSNLPVKSLWHFFLTTSLISIYVFFDVLILGWLAGDAHVGYYTVAIKIVKLSLLLVLSLNVILFPRISYLTANSDVTMAHLLIEKAMQFILLVSVPLLIAFYFLAPDIILLLAGPKFLPSVLLVRILSGLPLIIGFSNLLVYQILIPFGKEKKLLLCVVITCICSLVFHYILAALWLEKGTAIATLLTETLMTVLTAFMASGAIALKFPFSVFIQSLVASLPFVFFFFLCKLFLSNPIYIILVSGMPGILAYALLQLLVFRNKLVFELWNSSNFFSWRLANE